MFTQTKKSSVIVGDDVGEVQINENEGGLIGVNAPDKHQILIQRNGYTAGLVTVTGYAAGSDVEETVYEADGTTAMVINLAAASYFTRVVAPIAFDKLVFTAASTAGTPTAVGGWQAFVFSGSL